MQYTRPRPVLVYNMILLLITTLVACDYSTARTPVPDAPPPAPPTGSIAQPMATRIAPDMPGAGPSAARVESLAQVPACPSDISTPLFSALPVEPDDFLAFRPLGFLSPPIHMFPAKHSAFSMTLPGQRPVAKPVKAPGEVWVTGIWEASFSTGGANYQVFVYPCRDVRVYFGHIALLARELSGALQTGEPKCNSFADGTATVTTCRRENLSLRMEAGQLLGMGPDTAGVDFGVVDFRRQPAAFVNLEHYDHFYPYYASPLDYFTPESRRVLESKSGHVFGSKMRTMEPLGGTYMQDIRGTAQGNWFFPGKYHRNTTDLSPSLGLVHDYVDPRQPIMAIGNSVKGLRMGLYSFQVASEGLVNRDFSQVKPDGKTYCFDSFLQGQSEGGMPLGKPNGALRIFVPGETTLKLEFVPGSSCQTPGDWTFTADATVFER